VYGADRASVLIASGASWRDASANAVTPSSSWEKSSATAAWVESCLMRASSLFLTLTLTEHVQRQTVLGVRRNKIFQSVGGAAQLDEAREAVLLELVVAVEDKVADLVVVAEVFLSAQILEEVRETFAAHSSDESLWIGTDQELDELDVVGALERRPQRGA